MPDAIRAEHLARELSRAMAEYSEELTEQTKKAALEVSREATKELKKASPVKTGDYKKGWQQKKVFTGKFGDIYATHNKTDWQITHLLEFGHAKRNGGRGKVRAVKHIEPVESRAIENFRRKVEQAAHGNG